MTDIFVKMTGVATAINSLKNAGVLEMLNNEQNALVQANRHVAIKVFDNLITVRGTYDEDGNELTPPEFDGPHMMIRLLSSEVTGKAITPAVFNAQGDLVTPEIQKFDLLPGMQVVANPGTVEWFEKKPPPEPE